MPPRPGAETQRFTTGVLNVEKPVGETSFSVVNRLRRLTGAHRVGHAGTLDPLAMGVLPILFESATRLAEYALKLPKTYVADVHLGFVTATDDAEAEPEPLGDPGSLTAADVEAALATFRGRIEQRPPAYSAVKVRGERAYRLSRNGEIAHPAPRTVEVYEARLLAFETRPIVMARIEVRCSSGTYLRSIARDLGERLGVGGYLRSLTRTAYGPLTVEQAIPADSFTDADAEDVRRLMLPAEVILPGMERVRLNVEQEALVRQGRAVRVVPEPGPGLLRAHDAEGRLIAVGHADLLRRTFVPEKVLS